MKFEIREVQSIEATKIGWRGAMAAEGAGVGVLVWLGVAAFCC